MTSSWSIFIQHNSILIAQKFYDFSSRLSCFQSYKDKSEILHIWLHSLLLYLFVLYVVLALIIPLKTFNTEELDLPSGY